MKKTLIALAALGAMGAASAQSNVTIYGQLNPSYDYVKVSDGASKDHNITNMSDNASRLGFKGSEDLGGGLKAIFQLESYFNFVDGDKDGAGNNGNGQHGGFGRTRDAWVGMSGKFGSITFGAQDNALKKIFASYDPFGDTIADYNNIFSNGIDSRNSKSAYYTSPVFHGLQFQGSYALENQYNDEDGSTRNARYALGLDYNNGPLKLTAAYGRFQTKTGEGLVNADGEGQDSQGYRLGAMYTLPTKTKLTAVYDKESGKDSLDRKAFMVGVQHPINNIDLIANFIWAGDNDNWNGGDDSGAKNLNLGVRYNFSKRTNVMAMYTYLKNDDHAEYEMDTGYADGAGAKFSAFSVRLQHNF